MRKFNITVNGTTYEVEVEETTGAAAPAAAPVAAPAVRPAAPVAPAAPAAVKPASKPDAPAGALKINAPMPGNILNVLVKPGSVVKRGDNLLILEAMKMENEIISPRDGTVVSVEVSKGQSVNTGDLLVSIN